MLSRAQWAITLAFLFLTQSAYLQHDFKVDLIPDSLSEDANSVVRFSHVNIDIFQNKINYQYEYAITALNKKHEDKLIFYDNYKKKESKISDIEISIYDAHGNRVKKVKKNEIKEYGIQDSEFAQETRSLYYGYTTQDYPKTIHVQYKREVESPYYLRNWMPIMDFKQSVEQSSITIVDHAGESYVYETHGLDEGIQNGSNSISFKYEQKKPLYKEKYMPIIRDVFPRLVFALKRLKYFNHKGYVNDWEEFGAWTYNEMFEPKQDLKISKIREETNHMIDASDSKVEIAKKLYTYIQDNTRYILITLEDGGWSPLSTSVVHSRKYGDCKALSFYYNTLCNAHGIDATLALVNAGDEKLNANEDFYNTVQFNHVISKLNIDGNSYWVDCTSKKNPFNFLGDFTDDRKVLLLNKSEGRIDRTPEYKNLQSVDTDLVYSKDNGLEGKTTIRREGIGITEKLYTQSIDSEQKKESYQQSLLKRYTNPKIDSYQFSFDTTKLSVSEKLEFNCKDEGEQLGGHVKLKLNRGEILVPKLKKDKQRDWPIQFLRNKTFTATTTLKHDLSFVPIKEEDVKIESEFGTYSFYTLTSAGEIKIERELTIRKATYSPDRYSEIKSFFDKIRKVEKRTFLLSNKS